jgi:hypothetical protein
LHSTFLSHKIYNIFELLLQFFGCHMEKREMFGGLTLKINRTYERLFRTVFQLIDFGLQKLLALLRMIIFKLYDNSKILLI